MVAVAEAAVQIRQGFPLRQIEASRRLPISEPTRETAVQYLIGLSHLFDSLDSAFDDTGSTPVPYFSRSPT